MTTVILIINIIGCAVFAYLWWSAEVVLRRERRWWHRSLQRIRDRTELSIEALMACNLEYQYEIEFGRPLKENCE